MAPVSSQHHHHHLPACPLPCTPAGWPTSNVSHKCIMRQYHMAAGGEGLLRWGCLTAVGVVGCQDAVQVCCWAGLGWAGLGWAGLGCALLGLAWATGQAVATRQVGKTPLSRLRLKRPHSRSSMQHKASLKAPEAAVELEFRQTALDPCHLYRGILTSFKAAAAAAMKTLTAG